MEVINLAQCSQNGNENGKIFCYFLWNFYIQNIDFVFVYYLFWNNGLTVLENHFKTNFLGRLSSNYFKNFDFIICTFFYHLSFSAHSGIFISCFYWLESTDPNKWPFAKQPKKYLPLSFLSLECLDGYIDLRVLLLYCKKNPLRPLCYLVVSAKWWMLNEWMKLPSLFR